MASTPITIFAKRTHSSATDWYFGIPFSDVTSAIDDALPEDAVISKVTLTAAFTVSTKIGYANVTNYVALTNDDSKATNINTATHLLAFRYKSSDGQQVKSADITKWINSVDPYRSKSSYSRLSVYFDTSNITTKNWSLDYITLNVEYNMPKVITFDANGGTCTESSRTQLEGTQYGTLPIASKNYHTFDYWMNSAGVKINSTDTVTSDITLYAHWTPYSYKITFDGNGATGGSTASINTQYGKTEYLPDCGFTKDGYRFDGWEGGIGYKKAGDPVSNLCYTNNATYTFYATWAPNIFSIRYNPNGASGAPVIQSEQQTDFVNIVFNSNPYTRDGYTFINWNTKPDGSGTPFTPNTLEPNIFKPEHNSTIDVYAQWNPNSYIIHFSANGGIGSMSDLSMVYDTSKNLTTNTFTKAGHTFTGWNTAADGSGTHYNDGASVVNLATDGTKILYAQWTINQYTITWKDWDGSELEKKKWNYDTIPSYSGDTDSLSYETEDAFHDFDGWTPNIQKATADATYTATYLTTTKTYTVIWKNADGQELERDDNVTHGSAPKYDGNIPTLQSDDPKYYYVFNNWDAALKPVTNNITYTATYTKNIYKYTVIWNDWDGTELEKDVDVIYDTPPSYDRENPVRESTPQTEYIFIGWKTEINETPIEEDDLSAVRGDITYTAVYEARDRMYDFSVVISPSEECGYVTGYTDSAYKYGSELTLVAVPYDGCQFVSWYYTVNGIPQTLKNNQLELSIFEDTEITAIFEEKPNTPLYINETQVDSVYVNPDTLTITYVVADNKIILPNTEDSFVSVDGWSFTVSNDIPGDGHKVESIYIDEVQIY